jgi:hypothetical protein
MFVVQVSAVGGCSLYCNLPLVAVRCTVICRWQLFAVLVFAVGDFELYCLCVAVTASDESGAGDVHVVLDTDGLCVAYAVDGGGSDLIQVDGYEEHLVPVGVMGSPLGVSLLAFSLESSEVCDEW